MFHVASAATVNKVHLIRGLIRTRGDFNAFSADYGPTQGDRPVADLRAELESAACTEKGPPGFAESQLAVDTFVHHQEVRRPPS